MHLLYHLGTGAVLLLAGQPAAAVGAVAPDLGAIPMEIAFRRQHKDFESFSGNVRNSALLYRVTHSWFTVSLLACCGVGPDLCAGIALHLVLDLLSHGRQFKQQPLWPLPWIWKWSPLDRVEKIE